MPVVIETIMTPVASAPVDMRAMAASPLILLLALRRSSRKDAVTTTGMAIVSGAAFMAVASASAPKPTWERPSPIME